MSVASYGPISAAASIPSPADVAYASPPDLARARMTTPGAQNAGAAPVSPPPSQVTIDSAAKTSSAAQSALANFQLGG